VAVAVAGFLPQKYLKRHCPAQVGRTSRCGRHSCPRRPGSPEDFRSAPEDLPGTNDMALLGDLPDNRARILAAAQGQVGIGRSLRLAPIGHGDRARQQHPADNFLESVVRHGRSLFWTA
jgi:hypothetical protein